jgi:cyclophilin family peptidyl-prolyl cis-trans isomerase
MANKKKIEARLEAERKARQARYIRIAGAGIVLLVVVLGIWFLAGRDDSGAKQYDAYPPMIIDATQQYFARFVMEKGGEFTAELYADKAPKTVNNFVFLVREGFYDGTTFHRVLEGFMAQGGDPTGTGAGGPGYQFEYEPNDLKFDKAGVLAMANRGAGTPTNGSQFFITFGPTPQLDGGYTIFGQVIEGMDVVNAITRRDPEQLPDYEGDVIKTITIREE